MLKKKTPLKTRPGRKGLNVLLALPEGLLKKVDDFAQARFYTRTSFVLEALRQYIREKKQP